MAANEVNDDADSEMRNGRLVIFQGIRFGEVFGVIYLGCLMLDGEGFWSIVKKL